jgi:hypothetical protein
VGGRMKKWILLAGVIGFLAPWIDLFLIGFDFTSASIPTGHIIEIVIYIICPFFEWVTDKTSFLLSGFVYAGLYSLIAFLITFSVRLFIAKRKRAENGTTGPA